MRVLGEGPQAATDAHLHNRELFRDHVCDMENWMQARSSLRLVAHKK